ncbi:MAG: hypothetical protein ACREOH_17080, partial [Candidatus Entotheonellia bacterium]
EINGEHQPGAYDLRVNTTREMVPLLVRGGHLLTAGPVYGRSCTGDIGGARWSPRISGCEVPVTG